MCRECREHFPRDRVLAIEACITARAWPLSDKKPMGFMSDSGHVRAVMHAGIANWFPFKSVAGKRSLHSRHMHNQQFNASDKRLMMTSVVPWKSRVTYHSCLFLDIPECASSPCLNNATCTEMTNGYNCTCDPGWTGVHCETGT